MESNFLFRKKFMVVSLIITIVASLVSFYGVIAYASNKTVIVAESDTSGETETEGEEKEVSFAWTIKTDESTYDYGENTVLIPVNTGSKNVEVLSHLGRQEFIVVIKNTNTGFYKESKPEGDFSYIKAGVGAGTEAEVSLTFSLKEDCFIEASHQSGGLLLKFTPVRKVTKPIVILDPSHGGSDTGIYAGTLYEKEVVCKVAEYIKELTADKPYYVALTRTGDESLSEENRIQAIEKSGASMYLGLCLSSDINDVKAFGMDATYNEDLYIEDSNSVSFACRVLNGACTEACDRANGLTEAEEDSILKKITLPGTMLSLGYISNETELSYLADDAYLERVAQGIVAGLDEFYGD